MGHLPDHLQLHRRANLRSLIDELYREGYASLATQAAVLGINEEFLRAMLSGYCIVDAVAREVEWSMHRRNGWLDDDHRIDPG